MFKLFREMLIHIVYVQNNLLYFRHANHIIYVFERID